MGGSRSHLYDDSDDESDTLATGSIHSMEKISLRDHDQEGNFRRSRVVGQRHNSLLNWLQWGVIVALQAIIITLLCVRPKAEMRNLLDTETGGDINGLYPTVDHEYKRLKFEEDLYMPNMTSLDDRDEVRRRWDELLPRKSLFREGVDLEADIGQEVVGASPSPTTRSILCWANRLQTTQSGPGLCLKLAGRMRFIA
ncbi:MAG: hypothetical protein M1822_003267 [Bathelium mastoideum]|nr:MAG: hypothetical protein M1822_003267 [Bathelium mastoideum]